MPELPEVETIVRGLRPRLVQGRMMSAALSHDNVLDGVSKRTLLRELPGRTIVGVSRRAKHALIHTDTKILAVQPGMTGALLYHEQPLTDDERRYAVLQIVLDNDATLVYRDVRRIGTLRWLAPAAWETFAAALGPEPLSDTFSAADFVARLGRSKAAIKKVLMDQRTIVGVGNIYANEALFAAGIDPSRAANSIEPVQLESLYHHVRRILQAAIDSEGTTFRDYVTGTGEAGNFQLELMVYGREGEPCRVCGTPLAGTHDIDARATTFCWRCQR